MIRAVLFELCGTLVRAPKDVRDLREEIISILARLGLPPSFFSREEEVPFMLEKLETYIKASGMGEGDEKRIWDEIQKGIEEFENSLVRDASPVPGVLEVLALLKEKGLRIGVISMVSSAITVNLLARLGLNRFLDTVVARDFIRDPRPNSAHLLRALKDLGVRPEEAVLVSTSASMIRYAKEINMRAVGVSPGCGDELRRAGADAVVRSLTDVASAISGLEGKA